MKFSFIFISPNKIWIIFEIFIFIFNKISFNSRFIYKLVKKFGLIFLFSKKQFLEKGKLRSYLKEEKVQNPFIITSISFFYKYPFA